MKKNASVPLCRQRHRPSPREPCRPRCPKRGCCSAANRRKPAPGNLRLCWHHPGEGSLAFRWTHSHAVNPRRPCRQGRLLQHAWGRRLCQHHRAAYFCTDFNSLGHFALLNWHLVSFVPTENVFGDLWSSLKNIPKTLATISFFTHLLMTWSGTAGKDACMPLIFVINRWVPIITPSFSRILRLTAHGFCCHNRSAKYTETTPQK